MKVKSSWKKILLNLFGKENQNYLVLRIIMIYDKFYHTFSHNDKTYQINE